ncbi:MAG: membrane dipeptidase [Cyclobacteriaceae bacterium]|nr:membrane dipeptidase [Cyclobacteriaceae bacterium]
MTVYVIGTKLAAYFVDSGYNKVAQKPPYRTTAQVRALYYNLPFVADLHSDVLLWNRNIEKRHKYGHEDIPRMIDANLALQAFTIVSKTPKNMNFDHNDDKTDNITALMFATGRPPSTWFSLKERALEQCSELYQYARVSKGRLRVITNQSELKRYIKDRSVNPNQTAGFLGVEGMQVLEGDINNVQAMFDAGIRMMAPTHFFDNKLGGSAHGINKGGLTPFGAEVIKKMESMHMIVDLAHASPALIDDVLDIATRPLLVSHTGVKGTCNNVRNLSDEHLKRIAAGGGIVGIAVFEQAVCGTDAASTAQAIKYASDLIGYEHVALGSDFDGAIQAHFDVTGFPLIVQELLKLGFNEKEIAAIMGGNVRDFLLKNLPE